LTIYRELGEKVDINQVLSASGIVIARQEGDYRAARSRIEAGLLAQLERKDTYRIPESLRAFAILAAMQQQAIRAARLFGAAEAQDKSQMQLIIHIQYEERLASLRAALGEEAFAAGWAEGQAMTQEQAIACALAADET
jgi:hypothetical protein